MDDTLAKNAAQSILKIANVQYAMTDSNDDIPDWLYGALKLSERREFLCRNAPYCPKCKTAQVQLREWFHVPAEWKCRHCKTEFTYEPWIEDG